MRRRPWLAQLVSFLFATGTVAGGAVADGTHDFRILKRPLRAALADFARQSGASLSYGELGSSRVLANPVSGRMGIEAALDMLLSGTGIGYQMLPGGAVRLIEAPSRYTPETTSFVPAPIEEILVTSAKRPELLTRFPGAASATGATQMGVLEGTSTLDAVRLLPGIAATNQGDGRSKLIVRGLSDGAFSGRTQALVSTYLDNARLTYNAPEPALQLVDVDRIELLRGPQGTLYGSGALGGIYRIVTRKPDFSGDTLEVEAGVSVTDDGAPGYSGSLVGNLVLPGGRVAARGVAYRYIEGGYIDDIRLGQDNVNRTVVDGGRMALAFAANPHTTVTAGMAIQRRSARDSGWYNTDLGFATRDNYLAEPRDDLILHPNLTVESDLPFASLVASVGYYIRDIDTDYDATLAMPRLTGLDPSPALYGDDRHIRALSSEIHLNADNGGAFSWVAGLYGMHRHERGTTELTDVSSTAEAGAPPFFTEVLADNLDEIALFGELTWRPSERLAITGGMRLFHARDDAYSTLVETGVPGESLAEGLQRKTGISPKLTVSYELGDNTLLYGEVAEGYRLGGVNLDGPAATYNGGDGDSDGGGQEILSAFASDRLINYSLGVRQTMMGGRLQLSGALFLMDWYDIQSDQFNAAGLPVVGNIGDGHVFGGEVEFTWRPASSLELVGNVSVNQSELTLVAGDFANSVGATTDGRLPGSPSVTASLAFHYERTVFGDAILGVDGSAAYSGAARLLFDPATPQRSEAYVDGNLGISLRQGNWHAALGVRNLFNEEINSFPFGNPLSLPDIAQATPIRPRTISLRVGWQY